MSHGRMANNPVSSDIAHLFDGSALAGLTDGELLARFVATRRNTKFIASLALLIFVSSGILGRKLLAVSPIELKMNM